MKRFAVAAAAVLAISLSGCAAEVPPVSQKVQDYYDQNVPKAPTVSPAPAKEQLTVGDFDAVAPKLRASDAPLKIAVIGDSTGYPAQGWVETALKDIATKADRAVTIRTWDNNTAQYGPARTIGTGEPTLTVWNGSASGKDAQYSLTNLNTLLPEAPDMLIINHGHNVGLSSTIEGLLIQASKKAPGAAVAVMKQNKESGVGASAQSLKMAEVEKMAGKYPGVRLIDAFSKFPDNGGALMMDDGVHPNAAGYRVWADEFLKALGFA